MRAGWEYMHEHQAKLTQRDGFMCEQHPGLEFQHDPDCAGPGMPWIIEGKEAIITFLETRANAKERLTMEGKEMVEEWKRWLDSAEGKKCADPNTIGNGPRWRQYLANRLQMAFYAGIEAADERSEAQSQAQTKTR